MEGLKGAAAAGELLKSLSMVPSGQRYKTLDGTYIFDKNNLPLPYAVVAVNLETTMTTQQGHLLAIQQP